jgi:acylphosphatase
VNAVQVFYEGHVQGVGFRWSVKQIARGFDVSGFVSNLPDGRVELQASGADDEVRAFLKAIAESELRAHIKKTTQHRLEQPPNFSGFMICT